MVTVVVLIFMAIINVLPENQFYLIQNN